MGITSQVRVRMLRGNRVGRGRSEAVIRKLAFKPLALEVCLNDISFYTPKDGTSSTLL